MSSQEEQWLLDEYKGEKTEGFYADLARLASGEPLAFIIGSIPFLHTTIHLDSHPLIPRVETEFWVEKAIAEIKNSGKENPRVLDLCAGSGCIGVAVAKEIVGALVHFAELDARHHTTIVKNCITNGIAEERTAVSGGHLMSETQPPYDFILSNPPYIPLESIHVEESVTKFEPALALYGGEDGMTVIREIIQQACTRLTPSGFLYIEHEPGQAEAIAEEALRSHMTCVTHNDQYAVARYSILRMAQ
jgi:release factor glutamine methyltransferase